MKISLTIFAIVLSLSVRSQNPGEWMWIHGSDTTNSAGNFGTQGVASPQNDPPSFYTPCGWTDLNGNFWMFGSSNSGAIYSDLWKYDPVSNMWTWMKGSGLINDPGNYGIQGVPSPANYPPCRAGAVSWTDSNGIFWLYSGNNGGNYADLWKYDITTNEWTWMKGPSIQAQAGVYGIQGVPDPANFPGSRWEAGATWTDASNNLWLFGGGEGFGLLKNDLWKFDPLTNNWTWMKGSATVNQAGIYGTLGVEDSLNTPGGRFIYSHWTDNSGNQWLWGGMNYPTGNFNDLWKYNPVSNNWTWIGGTNLINAPAVLGTKCISHPANIPETGWENRAVWNDDEGNFWLFGGGTSSGPFHTYNQLWKYCIVSGEWTWVSGYSSFNPAGNWGAVGVSSPMNQPSGRVGSVSWKGPNKTLYLFGGMASTADTYNDLWVFKIDTSCAFCATTIPDAGLEVSSDFLCPGTCVSFTNLSLNATSYQWNFPGGIPDTSTSVNPTNICYNTQGNYDVTLIAFNALGSDTLLLSNYITIYPQPPLQAISQNDDTLFALPGVAFYQWYFNGNIISGATNYFYVASSSGDYNVVATDDNGCEVEAVINNVIASVQFEVSGLRFEVFPNPVTESLTVNVYQPALQTNGSAWLSGTTNAEISIYSVVGEKIISESVMLDKSAEIDVTGLALGLYYIEITSDKKTYRVKFVKR